MNKVMNEEIKRWTIRRKSSLVIESWVDDGKRGIENALRAKPETVRRLFQLKS